VPVGRGQNVKDYTMKKLVNVIDILLIVGGLNWGLVGFFDFNFVEYFICHEWIVKLIYVFIGFAALFCAFGHKAIRKFHKGK